jgi:hypothetical protein
MSMSNAISSSLAYIAQEFLADVAVTEDCGVLPLSDPVTQAGIAVKATKADDAEAEVALWDTKFVEFIPWL